MSLPKDTNATNTLSADDQSLADSQLDKKAPAKQEPSPGDYTYYKKTEPKATSDKTKKPSRLSKFFSKFQSPAVKATNDARERELEEDKRLGRKTNHAGPASGSTTASTAAFM